MCCLEMKAWVWRVKVEIVLRGDGRDALCHGSPAQLLLALLLFQACSPRCASVLKRQQSVEACFGSVPPFGAFDSLFTFTMNPLTLRSSRTPRPALLCGCWTRPPCSGQP